MTTTPRTLSTSTALRAWLGTDIDAGTDADADAGGSLTAATSVSVAELAAGTATLAAALVAADARWPGGAGIVEG